MSLIAHRSEDQLGVEKELLRWSKQLIELYRADDGNYDDDAFGNAKYWFLWNAGLADTDALEAAFDYMEESDGWCEMPIDCAAVFGRIAIDALFPTKPFKAALVFERLINMYADPYEGAYLRDMLKDFRPFKTGDT